MPDEWRRNILDHGSNLSTTTYDGAVSDEPTRLSLNFYRIGEDVW